MNCTVVCPIYTPILKRSEEFALINNIQKLSKYKFELLIADNLPTEYYQKFIKDNVLLRLVPNNHLSSITSYNKFIMSPVFWEMFDSEFVLICQYDAWIFSDQLEPWLNKKYDYIGAPWFKGFVNAKPNSPLIMKVGNGGLSLRKTKTMLKVIKDFSIGQALIDSVLKLKRLKLYYLIKLYLSPKGCNEDKFFSYCVDHLIYYQVAPITDSISFSFEINPEVLYKMNKGILPFGCHGWDKYSTEFWKQFIPILQ